MIHEHVTKFQIKMSDDMMYIRGVLLNKEEAKLINKLRDDIYSQLSILTINHKSD